MTSTIERRRLASCHLQTFAQRTTFRTTLGWAFPSCTTLHYSGASCEAVVGGNRCTTQDVGDGTWMAVVVIDGAPMLGFVLAEGHLLLHVNLFNELNE